MNFYQNEEKLIHNTSGNIIERVIEKLNDLKEIKNEYSEILQMSIETTTDLYNAMEEYELREEKNRQKRIISSLNPIYY